MRTHVRQGYLVPFCRLVRRSDSGSPCSTKYPAHYSHGLRLLALPHCGILSLSPLPICGACHIPRFFLHTSPNRLTFPRSMPDASAHLRSAGHALCSVLPFCICQTDLAQAFFPMANPFPHFAHELLHTKCCPQLSSKRRTLLLPPNIVTLLTHVDRVRCSFFRHNSREWVELEAVLATLVSPHVQSPAWLTHCTRDGA